MLIYRCRTQRHLSRAAKPVDEMVQATIQKWFADQDAHKLRESPVDITELSTQRLAVKGKLKKLATDWVTDAVDDNFAAAAKRELEQRLTAIDNQLLAATGTSPASTLIAASQAAHATHDDAATIVADMWQNMTVTQRAEAINEVAVVTILPAKRLGPGFDPTCIDIARAKLDLLQCDEPADTTARPMLAMQAGPTTTRGHRLGKPNRTYSRTKDLITMDRLTVAVEYRRQLRTELRDLLSCVRPEDFTLTELRDLLAIIRPARDRTIRIS